MEKVAVGLASQRLQLACQLFPRSQSLHAVQWPHIASARCACQHISGQGSAIGPVMYVVNAVDLQAVPLGNIMVKYRYAEYTYLVIAACNIESCEC